MTYKVKFKKGDHNYILDVNQDEFDEVIAARENVQEAKAAMSNLLEMLMKCNPQKCQRIHSSIDASEI